MFLRNIGSYKSHTVTSKETPFFNATFCLQRRYRHGKRGPCWGRSRQQIGPVRSPLKERTSHRMLIENYSLGNLTLPSAAVVVPSGEGSGGARVMTR
jgi:hypothetical protein